MLAALGLLGSLFGLAGTTGMQRNKQGNEAQQIGAQQKQSQLQLSDILANFDVAQASSGFRTDLGTKAGARKKIENQGVDMMQQFERQKEGALSWSRTLGSILSLGMFG